MNSLGSPVSCSPSSTNWKGPALPVGPGTAHTLLTLSFSRSCCNDSVSNFAAGRLRRSPKDETYTSTKKQADHLLLLVHAIDDFSFQGD